VRILLYCPLYPYKPFNHRQTLDSIFALDWQGKIDYMLGKDINVPGGDSGYKDITEKYNHARDIVLGCGYDALFTVEADMIIPSHTLLRLTRIDTDVCYGLYCSRHGRKPWLAYAWMNEKNGESVDHGRQWCEEVWGQAAETTGVGLGCTLIHRRVLEKIAFRQGGSNANDWYFSLDCRKQGFRQMHDFGVICGHIDRNNGKIGAIYPSLSAGEKMYEVKELSDCQPQL